MDKNAKEVEGVILEGDDTVNNLPALTESFGATMHRAEIDAQVSTARQYPRSIKRSMNNILSLATLDEQTAEECIYALPRGKKPIRGASIRLAEIIHQCWGNCTVDAMVVNIDRTNKILTAEGTFRDLETNAGTRAVVNRRISDKNGRLFNDDMIVVTGNAACSIARRNAILAGVPRAIWRKAQDEAEKVIAGDVITIAENRKRAIDAFLIYGIKPEQVFAALEVGGEEDIDLQGIITLRGMFSAIKNGESTVEDTFRDQKVGKQIDPEYNPLLQNKQNSNGAASGERQSRPGDEEGNSGGINDVATTDKTDTTQNSAGNAPQENVASADAGRVSETPKILFVEFSGALARANSAASLTKLKEKFWQDNKFPEADKDAVDRISKIYDVHVRRLKGTIDAKGVAEELRGLVA